MEFAIRLNRDGDAAPLREVAGLPLEGGEEAEVEDGGAEADGEIADGAEGLFGDGFGFGEVMGELGRVFAELFERGEFHAKAGEHLADFVVEFAGEGFALLLLGVHELGGEVPELLFGLFGFGALAVGSGFEGGDAEDAGDGDQDADGEGDGNDAFDFGAESNLAEVHLLVLLAVGGGGECIDFIGDSEDGLAAGTLLFAEEECRSFAAFGGGPAEDGGDGSPVVLEFGFEAAEGAGVAGGGVGFEIEDLAFDGVAVFQELAFVAVVLDRGGVEEELADEDGVEVDAAFEFLEAGLGALVGELDGADVVVDILGFLEGCGAGQKQQAEQGAETDEKYGPGPVTHESHLQLTGVLGGARAGRVRFRERSPEGGMGWVGGGGG